MEGCVGPRVSIDDMGERKICCPLVRTWTIQPRHNTDYTIPVLYVYKTHTHKYIYIYMYIYIYK